MRLAIHVFQKDARRLKWEAAAVIALTLVLAWLSGQGDDATRRPQYYHAAGALFSISMVAWCYLAIRVVQTDGLVGTDEDWMTRPVGRAQLAGGKALGLVSFLVVPVGLAVVVTLSLLGLEPLSRPGALAWYVACFALMLLAQAAAIGAVTRGLPAAAVSAIGVVAAVGLSESLLPARVKYWSLLVWAPLAVVSLAAVVGGAAALWVQYRSRRAWVARGVVVGAVVLAAVGQAGLGWNEAFGLQKMISRSGPPRPVKVEAGPREGGGYTVRLRGMEEGRRIRILRVDGVAESASGRQELERAPKGFGRPEWEENVMVAGGGQAVRMSGVVWYEVLAPVGGSAVEYRQDEVLQGAPGRCRLHVAAMRQEGFEPMVRCAWAFRAPEEVTVAVRVGGWESRDATLSGTQAGSPFPAELGMPVSNGTSVLPRAEFRLEEAAETGGKLVFRTWKVEGFYRQEFRIEGGL